MKMKPFYLVANKLWFAVKINAWKKNCVTVPLKSFNNNCIFLQLRG